MTATKSPDTSVKEPAVQVQEDGIVTNSEALPALSFKPYERFVHSFNGNQPLVI